MKVIEGRPGYFWFKCPGCGHKHQYATQGSDYVKNNPGRGWEFNGDVNNPTFTPSLLNTWAWGPERIAHRCHLFVRNGNVEFCSDCSHDKAGQTIALPELDEKAWEWAVKERNE